MAELIMLDPVKDLPRITDLFTRAGDYGHEGAVQDDDSLRHVLKLNFEG